MPNILIGMKKKLKQEQAETDLEHSAYGNMPKWAEHNPITFWQSADLYERKMAVPIENMKLPYLER